MNTIRVDRWKEYNAVRHGAFVYRRPVPQPVEYYPVTATDDGGILMPKTMETEYVIDFSVSIRMGAARWHVKVYLQPPKWRWPKLREMLIGEGEMSWEIQTEEEVARLALQKLGFMI